MNGFIAGLIVGALAALFVVGMWVTDGVTRIQTEAIHLNYAIYNPTNGQWMWRTNR